MIHRINSIYRATEGEGIFLGMPQVFVRYQGCNVGCRNCDSKDTWSFRGGKVLTTDMVIEQCEKEGFGETRQRVSITGGDPLDEEHQESVLELVQNLKPRGAWVNIEAAGDKFNKSIFDSVDFVSFDVKTPSTGVEVNLDILELVIDKYFDKIQIKSVVFDKKDFDFIKDLQKRFEEKIISRKIPWIITPVFNYGENYPMSRVEKIIEWNDFNGSSFRVISQQHKWIHGPNKKFV
jgi:7-carboxy-7-deazaguanine synthase